MDTTKAAETMAQTEAEATPIYVEGKFHPKISKLLAATLHRTDPRVWPAVFSYLMAPGDHEAALDALADSDDLYFLPEHGGAEESRRAAEKRLPLEFRENWSEKLAEYREFMLSESREAGVRLSQVLAAESDRAATAAEWFEEWAQAEARSEREGA